MKRSGILMHISSLPSKYGIGSMGEEAYKFIDFLAESKSSVWQVLPIGQTSFGDSPYQSVSSFAGNPYFIDLDILVEEGCLEAKDLPSKKLSKTKVEFGKLYIERYATLRKSYDFAYRKVKCEVDEFVDTHRWIEDYSLFMALKNHFGGKSWQEWEDDGARLKDESVLEGYRITLSEDINFYCYLQYLFFKQWKNLREYASKKSVQICGDLPIYCALDSADVWGNSENFQLSDAKKPQKVAGVPPDYFSADGQLWGNPLFDWEYLKRTNYKFWIRRMKATAELFDMVRIDHFIGFVNYYSIDATAKTAKEGIWEQGPKHSLFEAIKKEVPELSIIAEDLGTLSKEVTDLKEYFGYPGMHVLMFMIPLQKTHDGTYLDLKITENSIVYTGTHDNDTLISWWNNLDENSRRSILESFKIPNDNKITEELIKVCFSSVSDTVIIPIQDHLNMGGQSRMNTPGTAEDNWGFRIRKSDITKKLAKKILKLNKKYKRNI